MLDGQSLKQFTLFLVSAEPKRQLCEFSCHHRLVFRMFDNGQHAAIVAPAAVRTCKCLTMSRAFLCLAELLYVAQVFRPFQSVQLPREKR